MNGHFALYLAVMGAAALFCRLAGYLAMRVLPASPRIEAALRATPVSVMSAIATLAVANGGVVEGLALAAAVALTFVIGNDVAAALLAVAVAAVLRYAGV